MASSFDSRDVSSKERFFLYNSLTGLVKCLEGMNTTIDLRNDSFVTGIIFSVDGFMNIVIDDAVLTDARGNEYYFETLFIQARKIRYVHIPQTVPIVSTLKNMCAPKVPKKPSESKENTFKMKRAMKKHLETVSSLGECSKEDDVIYEGRKNEN